MKQLFKTSFERAHFSNAILAKPKCASSKQGFEAGAKIGKLALLSMTLMIISSTAFAYELSKQDFEIQVDDAGFGVITEKYYFTFSGKEDLNAFMQAVKKNGQDLLSWQVFDSRINPYFETPETISLIGFSFDPRDNVLELKSFIARLIASILIN